MLSATCSSVDRVAIAQEAQEERHHLAVGVREGDVVAVASSPRPSNSMQPASWSGSRCMRPFRARPPAPAGRASRVSRLQASWPVRRPLPARVRRLERCRCASASGMSRTHRLTVELGRSDARGDATERTALAPHRARGDSVQPVWDPESARTRTNVRTRLGQNDVPPAGFEPAFSALKGRRPRPLDHGGLRAVTVYDGFRRCA